MPVTEQPPFPDRHGEQTLRSHSANSDRSAGKRKMMSLFLRAAVAVFLITVIVWFIDIRTTVRTITQSDWRWIVVILLLALLDRYLMAYKWAMLLRVRGIAISNFEAFKIYLMSGFVGTFLPSNIGADAVKLARTTLALGNLDKVTASVAMERLVGMLALTVLALFSLVFLVASGKSQFMTLLYLTSIFFVTVFTVLLISLRGDISGWFDARLSNLKKYRITRIFLDAHSAYVQLGRHKTILVWFFLLSLLEHGILSVMSFLGALALDLSVSFIFFLALVPITTVVGLLPLSIGGIGVSEGMYVLLLPLVGISPEEAFAVVLYMRALSLLALIPGGVIFLLDLRTFRRTRVRELATEADARQGDEER